MSALLKLQKNEIKEMANTMSDAFLFHKNFVYLIGNQKRRKNALYQLFLMMYKMINGYGFIFVVNKEQVKIGYITFLDDTKYPMNFMSVVKTKGVLHFIMFLVHSGIRNLFKFKKYMQAFNKAKHDSLNEAIHLYSTGIKKEYRGQRLMSGPFKDSFDYFKELGYRKIRLETSDPSNIAVYEKLKFRMTETINSKDDLQTIYFFELEL